MRGAERLAKTTSIEVRTADIEEMGIRLRLTIVDTPGATSFPTFAFYRVSPGFYRVLPGFTKFYRVLPGFTEFNRVLPGLTGFLLGFTWFY